MGEDIWEIEVPLTVSRGGSQTCPSPEPQGHEGHQGHKEHGGHASLGHTSTRQTSPASPALTAGSPSPSLHRDSIGSLEREDSSAPKSPPLSVLTKATFHWSGRSHTAQNGI